MYDNASYQHWGVRSAVLLGVWLLALYRRSTKLAGGLPSGPILSGLSRTHMAKGFHAIVHLRIFEQY